MSGRAAGADRGTLLLSVVDADGRLLAAATRRELASAVRLRRWERRNGRQLLSEMFWSTPSGFYVR